MCFRKGTAKQLLYLIDESPSKQRYLQDQVCGVGSCKVPTGEGKVPVQELVTKVQVPVLVQAKSGQGQIQVFFITGTNCFWNFCGKKVG